MVSVLVVCTGNVCRSPIAEGFLRVALERRLGDEVPLVVSAGTAGWEGSAATPEAVRAAAEHGVDISAHVARRLLREHVDAADLVVAMAGEHRDAVLGALPETGSKTFTLKELVRLLESLPPVRRTGAPEEQLAACIAEADRLRASGFAGNTHDEDIVDPLGMPVDSYRAVAWELDEWCHRLADGLFGRAPARAASGDEEG